MQDNPNPVLPPVIAIDGPSGSGKGTVSLSLAQALGWHFLDSGAIYRAFALIALTKGANVRSESALLPLVTHLSEVLFLPASEHEKARIFWRKQEITEAIRTEACGKMASTLSAFSKIREALLAGQRAFRQMPGLVADGRDMGTIVFPNAILKVFLQATLEERAKRRYLQLKQRGKRVSLEAIQAALKQRDTQDEQRSVAPLKPAQDAFIIDTTHMAVDDVVQRIIRCLADKGVVPVAK